MNRKPKALVAAVALALVGTLLLTAYVRSAEARATSGDDLTAVIVVTDTISAGTPATDIDDLVTIEEIPAKAVGDGAVTDLDDLGDQVASVDLLPGEQLLASRFVPATDLKKAAVPEGLLEVTVSLDPTRALGGTLTPGQKVAVLASFDDDGNKDNPQPVTTMLETGAIVTRVQTTEPLPVQDPEASIDQAPTGSMLVTLALDASSVERVVFAAEHGRIWLSAMTDASDVAGGALQTKASVLS